jgi:hypothetical protein
MNKWCRIFCYLLLTAPVQAQVEEHFDDGELLQQPTWTGRLDAWTVNADGWLQSQSVTANDLFYLSTRSQRFDSTQWETSVQLQFNPSSANYVDWYPVAADSNLLSNSNGYFVRMGGTEDEISLYRKINGVSIKLIDGNNGALNNSTNLFSLKLIRANEQWWLFRKPDGGNWLLEGSVHDSGQSTPAYTGFLVKQSTASFFQRHWFDDVLVKPFERDTAGPLLQPIRVLDPHRLELRFDEAIDPAGLADITHFDVAGSIGYPIQALADSTNPAIVRLRFTDSFPVRTTQNIRVSGLTDIWSNPMRSTQLGFSFYQPRFADILIHEIMADPSPAVGLPETEWVELYNRSGFDVPLTGWQFGKTGAGIALPDCLLPKDSMLILCAASNAAALKPYGQVLGCTSFPALSNEGDSLLLQTAEGMTLHAIAYRDTWYRNELKQSGGWSLELIDPLNPCAGAANWMASEATVGGTPGKRNSVSEANPDATEPRLLRAYAADSMRVILWMSEPLDSLAASDLRLYAISNGIGSPVRVNVRPPFFQHIELTLAMPLQRHRLYEVILQTTTDCAGNAAGKAQTVRLALAEPADSLNLLVNEILFNSASDGADFVEVYHNGSDAINLADLYVANRNTSGALANIVPLSNEPDLLFPGDYRVFTPDPEALQRKHVVPYPDRLTSVNLPSMNDDTGQVILLYKNGRIIDQLSYSDRWHFPLLSNDEEVSLERLQWSSTTQSADNWMSASATVGYATPTASNSQQKSSAEETGTITLDPPVVSPDGDGQDDLLFIRYRFAEAGNVAQVRIYDQAGRLVRTVSANSLCGITGFFRWDGLTDKARLLPAGAYIVCVQYYGREGRFHTIKKPVVLGYRK